MPSRPVARTGAGLDAVSGGEAPPLLQPSHGVFDTHLVGGEHRVEEAARPWRALRRRVGKSTKGTCPQHRQIVGGATDQRRRPQQVRRRVAHGDRLVRVGLTPPRVESALRRLPTWSGHRELCAAHDHRGGVLSTPPGDVVDVGVDHSVRKHRSQPVERGQGPG